MHINKENFNDTLKEIRNKIKKEEKIMVADGDGNYSMMEHHYMELRAIVEAFVPASLVDVLLAEHDDERPYSLTS